MQAYVIEQFGELSGLVRRELADPQAPGPGQVLVRLRAASLNARELQIIAGHYQTMCKDQLIPGSDGAGEVVAVGAGCRVQVGARVMLTFYSDWHAGDKPHDSDVVGRGGSNDGTLCEYALVSELEVVTIPDHLSFAEAATLPCAALTAWSALTAGKGLLPGQQVLVQGGGGVSVFALQLAKLFGARVIALSSSAQRLAKLKALGADEVIDYRHYPDWQEKVLQYTQGQGVDVTVEVGGGATIERSVQATKVGGRLSLVGLLSGGPVLSPAFFFRGLSLECIRVGSRAQFMQMCNAISVAKLRPVIEQTYSFDQVPLALEHLASGKQFGKLVVRLD